MSDDDWCGPACECALCVQELKIKEQAAEIEKLREALQGVTPPAHFGESEQHKAWWAKARAALGETK